MTLRYVQEINKRGNLTSFTEGLAGAIVVPYSVFQCAIIRTQGKGLVGRGLWYFCTLFSISGLKYWG